MNIKRVILTVFMVVFLVMTVSAAENHVIKIGFDEISDYPVIELGNSGKVRIPDYSFHSIFVDDLFGARIGYEIENVVPYCMTCLKVEQNSVYDESRFKVYIDSDDELELNAFEEIANVLKDKEYDIVHFDMSAITDDKKQKKEIERSSSTKLSVIDENYLFNEILLIKLSSTVCGKIFKKDLMIEAFKYIDNKRCLFAEDMLQCIIYFYFAKSLQYFSALV